MTTATHTFSGLTTKTVAEIVGPEAASLLLTIENSWGFEHGTHHRWAGRMIYTEAGVEFIAGQLLARGHEQAGRNLLTALRNAVIAERDAAAAPAGFAPLPDESERPRNPSNARLADREPHYLAAWEAEHS